MSRLPIFALLVLSVEEAMSVTAGLAGGGTRTCGPPVVGGVLVGTLSVMIARTPGGRAVGCAGWILWVVGAAGLDAFRVGWPLWYPVVLVHAAFNFLRLWCGLESLCAQAVWAGISGALAVLGSRGEDRGVRLVLALSTAAAIGHVVAGERWLDDWMD